MLEYKEECGHTVFGGTIPVKVFNNLIPLLWDYLDRR